MSMFRQVLRQFNKIKEPLGKVARLSAAALLILGSVAVVPVSAATTYSVDKNNPACLNTPVTCYTTIQAAINDSIDGDTVSVSGDSYDEQVVIDNRDITLEGAGDSTIIQPSLPSTLDELYTYPAGVLSGWAGLKLASPILVTDSSNVTVRNLKVDGANVSSLPAGAQRLSGVLFGEAGGTISNVTVNNIKTAGYVDRTYSIDVSSVTSPLSIEITGSRVSDFSRTAIQAQGANLTADIHDNVVVGPGSIGPANVPNGIVLIAGASGTVMDNNVSGNHYTGSSFLASGIMLYQAATGIEVSGNEVFDVDDAVLLAGTSQAVVQSNILYDNVKGVQIEQAGATSNTITSNTIDNSSYGIFLALSAGGSNVASDNKITDSSIWGVNNESLDNFNAQNNWWGTFDADDVAAQINNPALVDYEPYCATDACSSFFYEVPAGMTLEGAELSIPDGYTFNDTPSITFLSPFTLTVDGNTVTIPAGTTITKAGGGSFNGEDFKFNEVSNATPSGLSSNLIVDGALQWGIPGITLEFSQSITLSIAVEAMLNGRTLSLQRSVSGSGTWTSDGIASPATCVVTAGICQFEATKASYYAATHVPAGIGGGGTSGAPKLATNSVTDTVIDSLIQPAIAAQDGDITDDGNATDTDTNTKDGADSTDWTDYWGWYLATLLLLGGLWYFVLRRRTN